MRALLASISDIAERGFSWRSLYSVLEARVFASLYIWLLIVPWLVSLARHLPESVSIHPFGSTPALQLSLQLPFSWYALYFSGIFFVLARLIYLYYCPKFLREHDNAGDARSRGLTVQYLGNETRDFLASYYRKYAALSAAEFDRLSDLLRQYRIDDMKIFMLKEMGRPIGEEIRAALEEIELRERSDRPGFYLVGRDLTVEKEQFFRHIFWDLHRFQDHAFPTARVVCTTFVALGSALFSIVAFQGLVYVFQQLMR